MQPYNQDKRFAAPFSKAPLKWASDQLGGQVMSVILLSLMMSFVIALKKPEALAGFAGCLVPILGALAYRAVKEDEHIRAPQILQLKREP